MNKWSDLNPVVRFNLEYMLEPSIQLQCVQVMHYYCTMSEFKQKSGCPEIDRRILEFFWVASFVDRSI